MAEAAAEIEVKLDVPPGFTLPDLSRFGTLERGVDRMISTYHDTADLDLAGSALTLRRREGDRDVGWQLKVPSGPFRTEVRTGPAPAVPPELAALVAPFTGGADVEPVARLETTRAWTRICDADGGLVAEVVVEDVQTSSRRTAHWREVEVELGDAGRRKDLGRIVRALVEAGARAAASASKLARAVDMTGPPADDGSVGSVLRGYLTTQIDAVVAGHVAIARGEPDAVHQTRVACRRIRSTLRTFEQWFDRERAGALEDELRWYAGVLGDIRDRDVVRDRLRAAVHRLPPQQVIGPVARRIDDELTAEIAAARDTARNVMGGDRYAALLAELRRWRADPPLTGPAGNLKPAVRKVTRKLRRRLATGLAGGDAEMHRARKAAKRLRYAHEVLGRKDRHLKRLQKSLGGYQDAVVAMQTLQRLAATARQHGEDGFTYGVLLAQQRAAADRIRDQLRRS